MINLLSGLAEGYVNGLDKNLEEQQKSDLRKLQIKQFTRELDAKEQIEQAKKGLLSYLTQVTAPTPAVQGNQDYNSPGADENTGFDVQSRPAMPGMSFKQAMNTPEALRLALAAGHTFNDIKQFQQPSLVDLMAEYQKNNAIGGSPAGTGTGRVNPVVRMNADGTGYIELDPNKAGELAVQQGRLGLDTQRLALDMPGGGSSQIIPGQSTAGMTPKQISELASKRVEEKPKMLSSINNNISAFDRLADAAKKIRDNPNLKNASGVMTPLGMIPGTAAKDVTADLDNLKSQVTLDVMQTLKESSAAGATGMGSLSNAEGLKLENNIASLVQSQSPKQLKENLQKIIDFTDQAKARQFQHYKNIYGEEFPKGGALGNKPSLKSFDKKSDPLGLR